MHSFLAENALVRMRGCDVVDADCQDLSDGTNGLYPSGGLSFMWLRLERSWSHCESGAPSILVLFLFLMALGLEGFGLEGEG